MKDITFYSMDFERLYILPQYSKSRGYISAYAEKSFNGCGTLEIDFVDDDLNKIIKSKECRDNLMVEWNGFWGIICAYQDKDNKIKLTGESLNGLLKRAVMSPRADEEQEEISAILQEALLSIRWITHKTFEVTGVTVGYTTDTYKSMDVYIEDLLKLGDLGYEITADVVNKQFVFNLLSSKESGLLLSTNNLNAYDFSETYINKTIANGGYYKTKVDGEDVWKYITLDKNLTGVYVKDVVLKATNETEAWQELRDMVADTETEVKTKGIIYGVDYNLGDIVRVQNNDIAVKKRITSVVMSQENGYIENPIFSEVE